MDLNLVVTEGQLAELNALLEYRLYDSKPSIDAALSRKMALVAIQIWNSGEYSDFITRDMLVVLSGLMNLTRNRGLLLEFYKIVNSELNSLAVQLWGYDYDKV